MQQKEKKSFRAKQNHQFMSSFWLIVVEKGSKIKLKRNLENIVEKSETF